MENKHIYYLIHLYNLTQEETTQEIMTLLCACYVHVCMCVFQHITCQQLSNKSDRGEEFIDVNSQKHTVSRKLNREQRMSGFPQRTELISNSVLENPEKQELIQELRTKGKNLEQLEPENLLTKQKLIIYSFPQKIIIHSFLGGLFFFQTAGC